LVCDSDGADVQGLRTLRALLDLELDLLILFQGAEPVGLNLLVMNEDVAAAVFLLVLAGGTVRLFSPRTRPG